MGSVRIIKCLCHGTRISALKEIAEKTGSRTIVELQRHAPFATNCKRCVPYVNEMLRTGQTEFFELLEPDSENSQQAPDFADDDEL